MLNLKDRNYWLLSLALFSFFLTWSFSFSLFPIWLDQTIGLSSQEMGLIFSAGAVSALLVAPCYGFLQDKLGFKKHLLLWVSALLLLSGPFFIYVYGPLLKSHFYLAAPLGAIFFTLAFSSGVGVTETYIERISRISGFEFGRARMWGSIGWATATGFAGAIFNVNPHINFWLASTCACIFTVSIILVKPTEQKMDEEAIDLEASKLNISDVFGLLKLPKFWAFVTYVMGVTCIYSVYDQQFPVYFASMFPSKAHGNEMFGYLNSIQVFLEAGGMFIAPSIVNRIGAKQGLILAGVIMGVRILGSGFAWDPISISVMKLLHAAELPIMLVAIFKYIAGTFDTRLSSTLYLFGFQFSTQVLASVLSILVGMMYDSIGFALSYKILGLTVLGFVVISHFLLQDTRDDVT